jgi:CheY-like chemotaxis protein
MALNGRLEDMTLLEILQIVAFSKKTGTLRVESPLVNGAILFRAGRVLCAFSSGASDPPEASGQTSVLAALISDPVDSSRAALLDDLNRTALRELVTLREGKFEFHLKTELPSDWEGLDVSHVFETDGLNPQELVLELARELDESRKDTRRLFESSGELEPVRRCEPDPPASGIEEPSCSRESESEVTLIVVDDERPVVEAVCAELADTGSTIERAHGAREALELIGRLQSSGKRLVLVTDLSMPTSTGSSFEGGFEITARLRDIDKAAPVLLMVETLSSEARARAKELGIRKVAFKPALTKLDLDEYRSDLLAFARVLKRELADLVRVAAGGDGATVAEVNPNHDVIVDFLKTMTDQLSSPANGIARMILSVAAKYVERALLFMVKDSSARGLAGLQDGIPTPLVVDAVRTLSYELQEVQPFAEAVYSREPVRVDDGADLVPEGIEPGAAREFAVFPLMHLHEVLALLYCDNPTSGAPLGKLNGLQLFLAQAGMALENASLHRRLRALDSGYSIENQGPLTQLTPIARRGR